MKIIPLIKDNKTISCLHEGRIVYNGGYMVCVECGTTLSKQYVSFPKRKYNESVYFIHNNRLSAKGLSIRKKLHNKRLIHPSYEEHKLNMAKSFIDTILSRLERKYMANDCFNIYKKYRDYYAPIKTRAIDITLIIPAIIYFQIQNRGNVIPIEDIYEVSELNNKSLYKCRISLDPIINTQFDLIKSTKRLIDHFAKYHEFPDQIIEVAHSLYNQNIIYFSRKPEISAILCLCVSCKIFHWFKRTSQNVSKLCRPFNLNAGYIRNMSNKLFKKVQEKNKCSKKYKNT